MEKTVWLSDKNWQRKFEAYLKAFRDEYEENPDLWEKESRYNAVGMPTAEWLCTTESAKIVVRGIKEPLKFYDPWYEGERKFLSAKGFAKFLKDSVQDFDIEPINQFAWGMFDLTLGFLFLEDCGENLDAPGMKSIEITVDFVERRK